MRQGLKGNPVSLIEGLLKERAFRCPGLTQGAQDIESLAGDLPKRLLAFFFKEHSRQFWVVFMGGTGTGKSTIFNALCGRTLSGTGVERPKTWGPIAYVYQDVSLEEDFPFTDIPLVRIGEEEVLAQPATGMPGKLLVFIHEQKDRSHLVLIDTPDVDSVEAKNREITEDLYHLADAVVFVTSQEKYADEVPFRFLQRILREQRPCYLLANKTQDGFGMEELTGSLRDQALSLRRDRVWLIPFEGKETQQRIAQDTSFRSFQGCLMKDLSPDNMKDMRQSLRTLVVEGLNARIGRLVEILEQENEWSRHWLEQLDNLFLRVSQDLVREEKERFIQKSRESLKREIRGLFNRYDVLAGPRRFVRNLMEIPFRLLGFRGAADREARRAELLKVREKMDPEPVLRAMDRFNVLVLESLSPGDERAPLFEEMRRPAVLLSREAVEKHLLKEQEDLERWLEETFQALSREIPKGKRWGIYSTSIMWGVLILSLETAIGGGFTILDAALDSALAPFVTKGAVELFAYQEIQRVAQELSKRYQQGLLSMLRLQKRRYETCLRSLLTPQTTMETLSALRSSL